VYLNTDKVGSGGGYISLAHVQGLYDAGWALGNHTTDHTDLTAVDQATAAAKLSACTSWLLSHGLSRGAYHMAFPYNRTSASARAAAAQAGIVTARINGNVNQQLPVDDLLALNSYSMDNYAPDFAAWRSRIDAAIDSGGTFIFYGHSFDATTLPVFQQIADYVAQRRLWTPTIDEWWNTAGMQAQAGQAGVGQYLYVACGDAGVQVVDISSPATPALMGRSETGGVAEDVSPYDDGVAVAAGSAGLQVVRAVNPGSPSVVGSLAGGTAPAQAICVRGTNAYVAAGADGLRIVSLADPAHPVLLGTLATPGDARDVTVVGSKAYVAAGDAGVQVIDVSDPVNPVPIATHGMSASAEGIVVFGQNAYVAVSGGALQVVALPAGES